MTSYTMPMTRSQSIQSRRRGLARKAWRWRMVWFGFIVVAGGVSYDFAPHVFATWTTIQHVSIAGVKEMKRRDIFSLLALPPESSLWTINPTALQQRLEAHPQIASASVGRALFHTLTLVIQEREPAAVFQHAGGQFLLDQDGAVLSIATEEAISGLPTFSGLAVIQLLEGDPSTRDRARLGVMAAGFLRERFTNPLHIDFRAPNEIIAMTEDVIFLVNQNIQQAWQQYLSVESTINAGLPSAPYEIDLRYTDKVIVRQRG